MSDQKSHQFRPPLYNGDANGTTNANARPKAAADANGHGPKEQQGWEAYRKWLSRVSTQPAQRSPLDSSVYSWKGYNNWADKVRQSWKSDDPADS